MDALIGLLILAAIAIGTIALAIIFWPITICVVIVGIIIYNIIKYYDDKNQIIKKLEGNLENYKKIVSEINDACLKSKIAFDEIPRNLLTVGELLVRAEQEYFNKEYINYWDSIETVALKFKKCDKFIHEVINLSQTYLENTKRIMDSEITILDCDKKYNTNYYKQLIIIEKNLLVFPINIESIKNAVASARERNKYKEILYKGQTNYEFASIFEQRKTNKLLLKGFKNLHQAIINLGDNIESSLLDLERQICILNQNVEIHRQESRADGKIANERLQEGVRILNDINTRINKN